mmetsp:Transcript_31650/g.79898  ORF Transcript_31650/g.79898 Transcript_31650/m.79898 type:complete len:92 (-) Transcript_31650:365-640(-)
MVCGRGRVKALRVLLCFFSTLSFWRDFVRGWRLISPLRLRQSVQRSSAQSFLTRGALTAFVGGGKRTRRPSLRITGLSPSGTVGCITGLLR